MKKKLRIWLDKILIALKMKKPFIWTPPESEKKLLERAYLKLFQPTIESVNRLNKGGEFQIELSYEDLDSNKKTEKFGVSLTSDQTPGIKFKITLPKYLNVGGVMYKESYGLSEELLLSNGNETYIIPQDSIMDFETKFPSIPQLLEGRFSIIKSLTENLQEVFCRAIFTIKDKEMIFPTSILDYAENHMKFDIPAWDRQISLMGLPMLTTKGMFSELEIKEKTFHFYGIEQIEAQVIDSIDTISIDEFAKVPSRAEITSVLS